MRDVMKAISIKPEYFQCLFALRQSLYAIDPRTCIIGWRRCSRNCSTTADNWYARHVPRGMQFLLVRTHVDEGLAEINKVIAAGPEVVNKQFIWHRDPYDHFDLYGYAMLTRANMYRRLHKFDLAKADYDWLIAHWPKESSFFSARATLFDMAQERSKALTDFDKALSLAPYNEYARLVRAGLLMSSNRDDEALADINFLLRGSADRSQAFSYRAEIYKKRGERQAALEDLEQAFSMDQDLVQQYQQRLIEAGYYDGKPDGLYSETMRNGVKACLIDPGC